MFRSRSPCWRHFWRTLQRSQQFLPEDEQPAGASRPTGRQSHAARLHCGRRYGTLQTDSDKTVQWCSVFYLSLQTRLLWFEFVNHLLICHVLFSHLDVNPSVNNSEAFFAQPGKSVCWHVYIFGNLDSVFLLRSKQRCVLKSENSPLTHVHVTLCGTAVFSNFIADVWQITQKCTAHEQY